MERTKMPRINRAAQFAPFNALRDLPESIYKSEKVNEKTEKTEVDEQTTLKISNNLMNINKNTDVYMKYFLDGYIYEYNGKVKLDFERQQVSFEKKKIPLTDILDLDIIGDFKY